MSERFIKVRTIIFTEACPLDCRYCDLKNDAGFSKSPCMTKEQIFDLVDQFDKEDDPTTCDTRLLFSGGEPFLYWEWIKEIIEKYEHRFQYTFNTSGYLLTDDILKFLHNYTTSLVLSVDGNERLTNYLRPVIASPYRTGYYKKLKEIIPSLLFYFPNTPYKIIINPRYVDLLYEMYLNATDLGFKYFTFILDFESRPNRKIPKNKELVYWNDNYTTILSEQVDLIIQDMIMKFANGQSPVRVVDLDKVVTYLMNPIPFSADNVPCKVFNNRTLTTLYQPEGTNLNCFSGIDCFDNLREIAKQLNYEYLCHNKICNYDENCPAFEYCALHCCPQLSYMETEHFFNFDYLECVVNKICYKGAIKLLQISNEICPTSITYQSYLNSFDYKEKWSVIQ